MTDDTDTSRPLTEAAPDYLIGQVISECKVLEKVGEGGFGTVYKAIDQNLQRPVALKVMLRSLSTNQEFVQKFIREAVTAAQLNHPNIVGIHKVDYDERRGLHYLVMEYVDGRTLSDLVDEQGMLEVGDTIPLMLQAADALATAHEHNIVHRDIKPENLMVTPAGLVKITDFGLAKSLSSTDQKTTKVMGTPHYMSPEQFEAKAVDGRSDIYSLGVTFYYLLSKDRPYAGENTVQIIYSILTQDPKPLNEVNEKVSSGLWQVIQKMIAKDPGDRYQTLRGTIEDLRKFRSRHLSSHSACATCGARNPRGRKFCRSCGAPLLVRCPSCDSLEQVGAADCSGCNAPIEKLVKIEKSIKAAKRFEALGDLRRAAESYQQVVELEPEHSDATQELSRLGETIDEVDRVRTEADHLMNTGEVRLALDRVDELMKRFPGAGEVREHREQLRQALAARKVNALLGEAEDAIANGDVRGALSILDKALQADPSREDVRGRRNELATRLSTLAVTRQKAARALAAGRYEEAFQLASEVLRLSPGDSAMEDVVTKSKDSIASVDEFVTAAQERLDRGELAEALSEFEAALSLRPGDPQIFALVEETRGKIRMHRERLALCRRLMAERDFREAARGLKEVLAERPDDTEAKSLLAACEKGLEETVRVEQVHQLLSEGRRLFERGDLSGALNAFAGVLQLDANNDEARSQRGLLEARLREERDVRTLADEHLQDGRYDEAVQALQRLREVNPARVAEIDKEIAEAKDRSTRCEGHLKRAEEALAQRAYARAAESAGAVLEMAPRHPRAVAVKKDADKALTTINRFLSEADRLIASELFDEAIESLDKAKTRGAAPDEYRVRREQCEQGRMALLKADATRSLVIKDFEAAIAAYEQVLELNRGDEDAQKGKRAAERRLRILTTEPLALRLGSAAVVLMMLGLVHISAIASTKQGVLNAEERLNEEREKAKVTAVDRGKIFPETDTAMGLERTGDWAAAATSWKTEATEFPADESLKTGELFCRAMLDAQQKPSWKSRLDALEFAQNYVGDILARAEQRRQAVKAASDRYVAEWFSEAEAAEAADPAKARELYKAIEAHPVASRSKAIEKVAERQNYLEAIEFGDDALAKRQYGEAARGFQNAFSSVEGDASREGITRDRLMRVRKQWMSAIKASSKQSRSATDEQRWYDDVIKELDAFRRILGISKEDVLSEFRE